MTRCKGITKKGTRCLKDSKINEEYCWMHEYPKNIVKTKKSIENPVGKPIENPVGKPIENPVEKKVMFSGNIINNNRRVKINIVRTIRTPHTPYDKKYKMKVRRIRTPYF